MFLINGLKIDIIQRQQRKRLDPSQFLSFGFLQFFNHDIYFRALPKFISKIWGQNNSTGNKIPNMVLSPSALLNFSACHLH